MESTDDILHEESTALPVEETVRIYPETQERQKQSLNSAHDFLMEAKKLLEDGLKQQGLTLLNNFNSAELILQKAIDAACHFIASSVENPDMPLEITEYKSEAYLLENQDLDNPEKRANVIANVLQLMKLIDTFIKYIGKFRIEVYSFGVKEKNA